MELIIGLAALVVLIGVFYYSGKLKGLDANKDGKIDAKDVQVAIEKVGAKVEATVAKIQTQAKKATTNSKNSTKKPAVKAKTARNAKSKAKA